MISPNMDPTFIAFQRSLSAGEVDLSAVNDYRKQRIGTQFALRQPLYQEDLQDRLEAVSDDYESRGIHGSGNRVADQNKAQTRMQGVIDRDIISTMGEQQDLDVDLAMQIAQGRRKASEESLNAAQRAALGSAKNLLSPYGG